MWSDEKIAKELNAFAEERNAKDTSKIKWFEQSINIGASGQAVGLLRSGAPRVNERTRKKVSLLLGSQAWFALYGAETVRCLLVYCFNGGVRGHSLFPPAWCYVPNPNSCGLLSTFYSRNLICRISLLPFLFPILQLSVCIPVTQMSF